MSYGLHPIAVSLSQLRVVLRAQKKPAGLIGRLFGSMRGDIVAEVIRDQGPLDEDDGFDDDGMTVEQALRDLLSGGKLNPREGAVYGYALFALCNQLGEFQVNTEWSPMSGEWAERVDSAMTEAGIPPETLGVHNHLMYRGAPLDIPDPDDFPAMGYLGNQEIAPAIAVLSGVGISAIREEVRPAVEQVARWLDRAQTLKSDLVFFYF